jgi:hypothetical protein
MWCNVFFVFLDITRRIYRRIQRPAWIFWPRAPWW